MAQSMTLVMTYQEEERGRRGKSVKDSESVKQRAVILQICVPQRNILIKEVTSVHFTPTAPTSHSSPSFLLFELQLQHPCITIT